ncbi:MAG: DUF402 domain-containing protein [Bacilli bacterium]|nr:DUF402 domain-containing protein [Bacilli bacterium]
MIRNCIGDKLQIQCYKHNGKIHRAWNEAVLLDVKKDYMVFGNNRTQVIEAEGNTWRTKEPAIMYFFKDKWYNIIAQLKKDGIYYYCNIATPYIIEEGTIKYIDYDLDLRVFPDGKCKVLDKLEYNYHKRIMKYSSDLDKVIVHALDELIHDYKKKAIMFDSKTNKKYHEQYIKLKEEAKKGNF